MNKEGEKLGSTICTLNFCTNWTLITIKTKWWAMCSPSTPSSQPLELEKLYTYNRNSFTDYETKTVNINFGILKKMLRQNMCDLAKNRNDERAGQKFQLQTNVTNLDTLTQHQTGMTRAENKNIIQRSLLRFPCRCSKLSKAAFQEPPLLFWKNIYFCLCWLEPCL